MAFVALFAGDADYPTLWQHITRLRHDCLRFGATGKRHLRLALLHLAAGNYPRAEAESRLSQRRSHDLPEATHALALALLGQALVTLELVEKGPGSTPARADAAQLVAEAAHAIQAYLQSRPDDGDAAALAALLVPANPEDLGAALAGLAGRT